MKLADILGTVEEQPCLVFSADCPIAEAADKIARSHQIRGIYIIDARGRVIGTVSLSSLISNIMLARMEPQFHARSLLTKITSNTMADIMDKHLISAHREDDLQGILEQMLRFDLKEIPVLDDDGKLVANVGILDLWKLVGRLRL